eukprot:TRINITY_DN3786_c1_g1_i1.p1 TRINITY_DN3786_c1_g1~~TRINITY_DN3786_c1_g1_i1.p1  ORF type:complete len:132 (+),score=39.19 TRINITY_DN3786_c1_g1_i1:34-396(+)
MALGNPVATEFSWQPGDRLLYTTGADDVRSWHCPSGVPSRTISDPAHATAHTDHIFCLALLGNGVVCSGSADSTVRVWDPHTGNLMSLLEGHTKQVNCIAAAGGAKLLSCSQDCAIVLWR